MMQVTNIKVVGIEDALRGMRNPKDSWDSSDSKYFRHFGEVNNCGIPHQTNYIDNEIVYVAPPCSEVIIFNFSYGSYRIKTGTNSDDLQLGDIFVKSDDFAMIGHKDMKLCKQLISGGPVHSKFARMINVYMDISASFDFWKEYDTYKVATVANSCSTMHTIHKHKLDISNFSLADLTNEDIKFIKESTIPYLNSIIEDETLSDLEITRRISKLNILGFQQKRTVLFNYETLLNMITWRSNHKLFEWRYLTNVILKNLPYVKSFYLHNNI